MNTSTLGQPDAGTRARRGWALAGLIGGLTALVGLFLTAELTAPVGDAIADSAAMVDAIRDGRELVWANQVVCAIAAVCILIFAAGLRRHLGAQQPAGSLVPEVAMGGLGLVAVALLIGGGISTELYWALGEADTWDPDAIFAMVEIYNTMAWLWLGAGLAAAAVAVGGFKHGSVGRGFATVSLVLAVLVAATQAYPAQYAALFPGALWVAISGLRLAIGSGGRRVA